VDRRKFLFAGSALAISETISGCIPTPIVPPPTTVSVNMLQLFQAVRTQNCPEWCWAACIAMIFNFHGHSVKQEEIVAANFGGLICAPAGAGPGGAASTITRALTGTFSDDAGKLFTSQVIAAYDPSNGINNLSNSQIISELSNNQPMIYCNTMHAMVLYSMSYTGSPQQPNVVEVDVIDPWPGFPRSHPLSPPEMVPLQLGGEMTYLAAIRVI
jgi:hypothetical protein